MMGGGAGRGSEIIFFPENETANTNSRVKISELIYGVHLPLKTPFAIYLFERLLEYCIFYKKKLIKSKKTRA